MQHSKYRHKFRGFFLAATVVLGTTAGRANAQVNASATVTTPAHGAFTWSQNAKFAGVGEGFAGAIGIDMKGLRGPAEFAAARRAALLDTSLDATTRSHSEHLFRRLGALGPHTPLSQIRIVSYTRNGQLPARSFSVRSQSIAPRGDTPGLTFKYSGFTAQDITEFSSFRDHIYPLMVALYGDPAPVQRGKLVTVVFDSSAGDGVYEFPASNDATSGGTIRYQPVTTASGLSAATALAINNYNLSRLMLIAFHGPSAMAFDGWERGFADAAALIVNYQMSPSPSFDPSQLGVYLLPVYDILNRPELGNPFFFASTTSPNLGFYRLGMAQAAWIKVWVQNPGFFKSFNASYYAGFTPQLAGNTPQLKALATAVVPTVEGLGFNDWYRRQYVLDTSVTPGEKLWLGVVPQANLTSGDLRSVFFGVAQHFSTDAVGNETPVGGQGIASATNELGVDATAQSDELRTDNRVIFNDLGEAEFNSQNVSTSQLPIVGFAATGTPDKARITIKVAIGTTEATAIFPYNVAGSVDTPSGIYGATVGSDSGQMAIKSNAATTASPAWARGAFSTATPYTSRAQVQTTFTFHLPGEAGRSAQRNSAWSFYNGKPQSLGVILQAHPAGTGNKFSAPTSGSNTLRMISLPLYPLLSDEAAVLGVTPANLMLARYRPTLVPQGFTTAGIAFGVAADKHELYPDISEPFAPGRGYWLKANSFSATVRGSEPSHASPFEVPLLGGWNQVGVPFKTNFALAALQVKNGSGAAVPFATAVTNGWIGAGIWRWLPAGGYSRVDIGDASNQTLVPFDGYYFFSVLPRGLKLLFDTSHSQAAPLTAPSNSANSWALPLGVTAGGAHSDGALGTDGSGGGGAKPSRFAAANAPAANPALTLAFLSSGNPNIDGTQAGKSAGWNQSFVGPLARSVSWSFLVDGIAAGTSVQLSWGSPKALPVSIALTLVDERTGKKQVMGSTNPNLNYTFISEGIPRHFHVDGTITGGLLNSVSVQSLGGSRNAWVSATFGGNGKVSVNIESVSGGSIRNLAGNQSVQAGTVRWSWSGVNYFGFPMPNGHYIAHVTATDPVGTVTEARVAFDLS